MTDIPKPKDPTASDDPPIRETGRVDKSRRNLAKAALASPVIMTLASRPVWGNACTESALGSMTHASLEPDVPCLLGCSLAFWQSADADTWLFNAGLSGTTSFGTAFGMPNSCGCFGKHSDLKQATLQAVLAKSVIPLDNPRRQAVAAAAQAAVLDLLNASAIKRLAESTRQTDRGIWYPRQPIQVVQNFLVVYRALCDVNPCTGANDNIAVAALNTYAENIFADLNRTGRLCPFRSATG